MSDEKKGRRSEPLVWVVDMPVSGAQHDTTRDAERWLKENGEPGVTYTLVRHVKSVVIKSEVTRKVTLEEA